MLLIDKTYLVAIAALPYFLIGSRASPTPDHTHMQIRNEPGEILFPEGGLELSDIAIHKQNQEPRSEKATIFSQGLIVTRKLNKQWLPKIFMDYDGKTESKSDKVAVKPFYWGTGDGVDDTAIIELTRQEVLDTVKEAGVDDMKFGVSDSTPWWPYAAFAGASKYGWGKKGGKEINGLELVKQTLETLTGYPAEGWAADTAELQESIPELLKKADETPFIIQIKPFDLVKHEVLKDLRWEQWVSVMSYDDDTKQIQFATSFYDGDDGITQSASIAEIEIESVVQLRNLRKLDETQTPVNTALVARDAPQETSV